MVDPVRVFRKSGAMNNARTATKSQRPTLVGRDECVPINSYNAKQSYSLNLQQGKACKEVNLLHHHEDCRFPCSSRHIRFGFQHFCRQEGSCSREKGKSVSNLNGELDGWQNTIVTDSAESCCFIFRIAYLFIGNHPRCFASGWNFRPCGSGCQGRCQHTETIPRS